LRERGTLVVHADVTDRYGGYGITALAMCTPAGRAAVDLDTFLMSCRVMGRGVERAFLATILDRLKAVGVKRIRARYLPTAKNMPAREFLPSMGFAVSGATPDGGYDAVLDLDATNRQDSPPPATISVHTRFLV
jgi:predicted enzyme involved in methoxymalonyl-ACP biosynthesis